MTKRFCVFIIVLFLLLGCTSAYAATRDDAQIFADQYVTGSNTYLSCPLCDIFVTTALYSASEVL